MLLKYAKLSTTKVPKFVPAPAPLPSEDELDNDTRREYLTEIGVPAAAIAAYWNVCNGGSAYEEVEPLKNYLEDVLFYYTGYSFSNCPIPYTEKWKETRSDVVDLWVQDEAYGF